jgi:hypothetical protein
MTIQQDLLVLCFTIWLASMFVNPLFSADLVDGGGCWASVLDPADIYGSPKTSRRGMIHHTDVAIRWLQGQPSRHMDFWHLGALNTDRNEIYLNFSLILETESRCFYET